MQTTLDCNVPPVDVDVTAKNTTILSDEHIEYLYQSSIEGIIANIIEQKLQEERNEADEIRRRYEDFKTYEKPQNKPQYIRVGKNANNR